MDKSRNTRKRIMILLIGLLLLAGIIFIIVGVVIPRQKYQEAMGLLANGEYDAAYGMLAELGKGEIVTGSINERADALLEAGDGDSAYALLAELTDEESRTKRMEIKRQQIRDTQEGKYFTLGRYEQDNKPENGPEPIEWMVLARDGDRVLVISRYILDCVRYDEEYRRVTWKTCTLRAWLNGEFLDSAFDAEEQLLIPTTHVTADPNPKFDVDPGEDTEDKLFLLSIPEAEVYFHPDPCTIPPVYESVKPWEKIIQQYQANPSTLYCKPTAYAAARGNIPRGGVFKGATSWWLRAPGMRASSAALADSYGLVAPWGALVNCDGVTRLPGVRPAMWIDLGT
jgi:hypothetical protein